MQKLEELRRRLKISYSPGVLKSLPENSTGFETNFPDNLETSKWFAFGLKSLFLHSIGSAEALLSNLFKEESFDCWIKEKLEIEPMMKKKNQEFGANLQLDPN